MHNKQLYNDTGIPCLDHGQLKKIHSKLNLTETAIHCKVGEKTTPSD